MPSELKLQIKIPGVTTQDYYRVVLSDDQCIRRFHKEVTGDPDSTATPWEGGQRTVTFLMTLNMPAVIKKLIGEKLAAYFGTECIRVMEGTQLTWQGDNSFELVSEPCLDFPAANKFKTSGLTQVSNSPDGGCQVDCIIRCTAMLPWPMQSTVESAMISEGKATLTKYLEFTRQACEEDMNNRATATATPLPHPGPGPGLVAPVLASQDDDEFFDVFFHDCQHGQFEGAEAAHPAAPPAGQQQEQQEAGPIVPLEQLSHEEVVVRCLLQIQKSCHENTLLMRQMQGALQRIDDNIASICSKVASVPAPVMVAAPTPTSVAATGPGKHAAASNSYKFTYLLCLGLAGASAVSIIYLRAKARTSS